MTIIRTLTGLALATVLVSIAPAVAHAATGLPGQATTDVAAATSWGAYYAPGRGAKALGSLKVTGEDHEVIPTAATAKISGKVYDLTRKASTCGLAVFRITYLTSGGKLPFKHHTVRDCSYGTPKNFAFSYRNVYEVELKVCSEGGKSSKPSNTCLYAGAWKVIYLSK
ncbi:hypothetical protein [Streptosporangium subroseum]|uniref:hypothetical protein n=1 Tax=Streptosporangium subroseum TaxID=106412 RepID=UPI0030926CD7|nr:hypothetical protein OHB15_11885 [Streptosporangium subroseum]